MSEKPTITDEPLPDAELVASQSVASDNAADGGALASDTLSGAAEPNSTYHDHLPDPHLNTVGSGYGHNDPASVAGKIQLDLHAPALAPVEQSPVNPPIWGAQAQPPSPPPTGEGPAVEQDVEMAESKPAQPHMLAHLAQVGLVSADQWEEQIQPRLTQLHDDIAQVHTQLDVLERQKPKK